MSTLRKALFIELIRKSSMAGLSFALIATKPQELMELRRKYHQVQMERDILAKATAWFANNGDKTFTSSTR